MQRRTLFVATAALVLATLAPAASAQPDPGTDVATLATGAHVADKELSGTPQGPNPWLALLPDPATADYAGWEAVMRRKAAGAAAVRARSAPSSPNGRAAAATPWTCRRPRNRVPDEPGLRGR